MNDRLRFLLVALLLAGASASAIAQQDDPVRSALRAVQERLAPDLRLAVFDVSAERHDSVTVLKGNVDQERFREEALAAVRTATGGAVLDSIRQLPDPALGDRTFGIVTISVGNVRSKPGEPEELSTQVLMGSAVKVLKKGPGFYYIQASDRYLGWLDGDSFIPMNRAGVDAWAAARKVIVTGYFGVVHERPDAASSSVCDAVMGNLFRKRADAGAWMQVELADGRSGYIERSLVQDYEAWQRTTRPTPDGLERTARMFIGVPYLWGGASPKGMDCSGFVKTVYRGNGLELLRDANQQATQGTDVPLADDFASLKKGDLLFFGRKASASKSERITHVALYLGGKTYIHSSGRVRINSLDPASPIFDEYNLKRLVRARRVLPAAATSDIPR